MVRIRVKEGYKKHTSEAYLEFCRASMMTKIIDVPFIHKSNHSIIDVWQDPKNDSAYMTIYTKQNIITR